MAIRSQILSKCLRTIPNCNLSLPIKIWFHVLDNLVGTWSLSKFSWYNKLYWQCHSKYIGTNTCAKCILFIWPINVMHLNKEILFASISVCTLWKAIKLLDLIFFVLIFFENSKYILDPHFFHTDQNFLFYSKFSQLILICYLDNKTHLSNLCTIGLSINYRVSGKTVHTFVIGISWLQRALKIPSLTFFITPFRSDSKNIHFVIIWWNIY